MMNRSILGGAAAILLAGGFVLAQSPISVEDAIQPVAADIESDQKPESEAASPAGETRTTESGLQIQEVHKQEKAAVAQAGDAVFVHYTGTLEDGTKFDSSLDRGQPIGFRLGQGEVIKGWDEGIAGMSIGDKRKLTIPSDLGYGEQGSPPTIPGGATLLFDVELVGLVKLGNE